MLTSWKVRLEMVELSEPEEQEFNEASNEANNKANNKANVKL
jgi:hypothetical protein